MKSMTKPAREPARDCSIHVLPRQEMHGPRLFCSLSSARVVSKWTLTSAAAWTRRQPHDECQPTDTLERDHAGSERPTQPDGSRFVPGRTTSEGRAVAE